MKSIAISSVKRWNTNQGVRIPSAISTTCPHCDAVVTFSLGSAQNDPKRVFWISAGQCPSCDEDVSFASIEPANKGEEIDPVEICMHPSPSSWRQQIAFTNNVPEPLQRAFASTVDAFNTKNYVATAVCCRRTLEGIFKYRVGEAKRKLPLIKLIKEVQESQDLAEPLNTLSHAIRAGGNLGAHFDEEAEPSHEMARHMVELLEYLLSYLYILPDRIANLDKTLNQEKEGAVNDAEESV
jgi:Domain of unknown function (DUF4145)